MKDTEAESKMEIMIVFTYFGFFVGERISYCQVTKNSEFYLDL